MRRERAIRRRRLLVAAAIIALTLALLLVLSTASASAHRGHPYYAELRVERSNMGGHCGNGWMSYCYKEYNQAWVIRAADAHLWLLGGYWQERRIGHGRYACEAKFLASRYHGVGYFPNSESCHKL